MLVVLGVHFSYAGYEAFNNDQVVTSTNSVPFFQPVSARHFFQSLGFDIKHDKQFQLKGKLNYPLNPLNIKTPAKPYNIIWLTAESWRADTLNDHIMPATWKFAEGANRFTQNYSGGNGTRMGVFSMFTGLPGNYWFPFLDENRGTAFIDVLQQEQYQIHIYTSALFSYPEFSKTLFSKLQKNQMQELQPTGKLGWENDRQNVTDLLNFIDTRDKSKPFFTFMFFESPHARYYFPPESVIAKPYNDDINYASLDKKTLRRDIVPIKNRYINAVHHLDSQFDRVFKYLDEHNLRDNTIVILLGDHGEEFMEHGFWVHNSTFVDEQVRTPLIIWQPGQTAKVHDKLTSHMDIIPTVMPLLGVQNPVSDYALGYNLMGKETRPYTYISDWSRITYKDNDKKITIPIRIQGFTGSNITGGHDEVLTNEALDKVKQQKAAITVQIFEDLHKFTQAKTKQEKAAKN
jgi:membrane-anchored protein YejM (alkaline phosphatase superfamily)